MKRPPEMSRAQFAAACRRHGFVLSLLWISCPKHPDPQKAGTSIGIVYGNNHFYRRATLAKAIKFFEVQS